MKASIPDTGMVIRLEGGNAVISMQGDASCRKCGAATIGLCKGGMLQILTVRNSGGARAGDLVNIRLAQEVQNKGYLLAYVIPVAAFILGIVAGYYLGEWSGIPLLDIITGFASLAVAAAFSFRRLKTLDAASSIEITSVLLDPWVPAAGEQCGGARANL